MLDSKKFFVQTPDMHTLCCVLRSTKHYALEGSTLADRPASLR